MLKKSIIFSLFVIAIHSFQLHHQPWNPLEIANVAPRISLEQLKQFITTDLWDTMTSPDLISRFIQAIPAANDTCSRDIIIAIAALEKKNMTAIELFDSWAKAPPGILEGNFQWLGSFDQCRNVNFDGETHFKGQYCLAKLGRKDGGHLLGPSDFLLYGFCFPNSCSQRDAATVFGAALSSVANSTEIVDLKCDIPPSFEKADIAFISLSIVMILLVIMGTIVDFTYRRKASNQTLEANTTPSTESTGLLSGSESTSRVDDVPRLARFCICFSLLSNGAKLLSTSSSRKAVLCVNGIRVFSMNWIVLCHTFSLASTYLDNPSIEIDLAKRFSFQPIINGFVSVDSFFFLSGFLVGYLTFLELESRNGKLNWFLYYFHRIIRIVPLYGFMIFFFVTMTKHLGDGPLFPYYIESNFTRSCESYWWTNLLFINNFYPKYNFGCFQWSWYLANDMQFFLLSPILIYPLFKYRKLGVLIALLMMLASTITYGLLNTYYGLSPRIFDGPTRKLPEDTSTMELTYTRPYTRIQPYIVGILAGYLLFVRRGLLIGKVIAVFGWIAAASLGFVVVYGLYPLYSDITLQWDQNVYSLYNCTFRLVWGVVMAWIVIACHRQRGGLINAILSWKVWIPLSRLTYSVYLVHIIVICVVYANQRALIHYTDVTVTVLYTATLVLSYAAAFLFALFIEYPLFAVEELLRKRN